MNIEILIAVKNTLVAAPMLIHIYIMYLEMFLWVKKRKVFGMSEDLANQTRILAYNQGLYNGFLAAGLIWSFLVRDFFWSLNIQTFFLSCIFIAGIAGARTVTRRIFWIQSFPAVLPLFCIAMIWILFQQ